MFFLYATLTILLNGCLSTKTAVHKVELHDNAIVKEQSTLTELPPGISFTMSGHLPNHTSVKKSYFMVLPLLIFNIFQTNHKITLGQSSIEIPPDEIFKREFVKAFDSIQWNIFYQNGHSIDIDIRDVKSTGVFASGYAAAFGAGYKGAMGKIATCMRMQTKANFVLTIQRNDSTLLRRDLTILINSGDHGNLKLSFIDIKSGKTVFKSKISPYVITGDTFDLLIPLTKDVYEICAREVAKEIVGRANDSLLDYYSVNK